MEERSCFSCIYYSSILVDAIYQIYSIHKPVFLLEITLLIKNQNIHFYFPNNKRFEDFLNK